jgi:hypothetical protein
MMREEKGRFGLFAVVRKRIAKARHYPGQSFGFISLLAFGIVVDTYHISVKSFILLSVQLHY